MTPAQTPARAQLRALVDAVWNCCTDSQQVPSTATADRLIDRVLGPEAWRPMREALHDGRHLVLQLDAGADWDDHKNLPRWSGGVVGFWCSQDDSWRVLHDLKDLDGGGLWCAPDEAPAPDGAASRHTLSAPAGPTAYPAFAHDHEI